MRAVAFFVWIFLNLVCFGMCGYIYLIWSQYWLHLEKQDRSPPAPATEAPAASEALLRPERLVTSYAPAGGDRSRKRPRSAVRAARRDAPLSPAPRPAASATKSGGRPRFPNVRGPLLELDTGEYSCTVAAAASCRAATAAYKDLVLKELHRVLMEESDVFRSGVAARNAYGVRYDSSDTYRDKSARELLCELAAVAPRTVSARDEPFAAERFRIPAEPPRRTAATCAVVSNAGALYGSGLGTFIDSHDVVVRFNNAPTDNYTADVGARTTLRVLNSQVVAKKEYDFEHSPLYRDVEVLAWDPARYPAAPRASPRASIDANASLADWYRHPDYPLFDAYKRYLETHVQADARLLHPTALWALWDFLQRNSPYRIRKNPPSSGFIGIWYALWRCARVRVVEFVPSTRATRRCHYYSAREDAACTLGAWHPLAQEKSIAERMRDNSDFQVFQRGYLELPGFSALRC